MTRKPCSDANEITVYLSAHFLNSTVNFLDIFDSSVSGRIRPIIFQCKSKFVPVTSLQANYTLNSVIRYIYFILVIQVIDSDKYIRWFLAWGRVSRRQIYGNVVRSGDNRNQLVSRWGNLSTDYFIYLHVDSDISKSIKNSNIFVQ